MISSKRFALAVSMLTLAGLALRLWNIDFGLPDPYHPDEKKKFTNVVQSLGGQNQNFANHPFAHPGLMIGMATGAVRVAGAMGMKPDIGNVLLTGRILAALCLTLTIVASALLASALYDRRAGVLAAAIAAFSPVAVVHSRYFKEDAFITPFIVASLLFAAWWIRHENTPRRIWTLAACAVAAGFAFASKYIGIVVPIVLLAFLFIVRSTPREKIVFTLASLLAFALGSAMLFEHPGEIWGELQYAFQRGSQSGLTDAPLPIYHRRDLGTFFIFNGINWGLGWPLTIVGLWATARAVRLRRAQPAVWLVALMTIVWYFCSELTTLKRAPNSERYILPCIPLMGVLAAGFIMNLRWRRWPAIAWLLVAALAIHSVALTWSLKPDTRELAAQWYNQHKGGKRDLAIVNGPSAYTINTSMISGTRIIPLPWMPKHAHFETAPAERADAVSISEYTTARFENFAGMSPRPVRDLQKLRDEFPYAKIFKKPWYAQMGFHNPRIEIRFRTPMTETSAE